MQIEQLHSRITGPGHLTLSPSLPPVTQGSWKEYRLICRFVKIDQLELCRFEPTDVNTRYHKDWLGSLVVRWVLCDRENPLIIAPDVREHGELPFHSLWTRRSFPLVHYDVSVYPMRISLRAHSSSVPSLGTFQLLGLRRINLHPPFYLPRKS